MHVFWGALFRHGPSAGVRRLSAVFTVIVFSTVASTGWATNASPTHSQDGDFTVSWIGSLHENGTFIDPGNYSNRDNYQHTFTHRNNGVYSYYAYSRTCTIQTYIGTVCSPWAQSGTTVAEGGALRFAVTKSGSTALAHRIHYSTTHGSVEPSDYSHRAGTLTFGAHETNKVIQVPTTQDAQYEASESVYLDLSAPTNHATIADSHGTGTITNDDAAPSFSVNTAGAAIGDGRAVGTIICSEPLSDRSFCQIIHRRIC